MITQLLVQVVTKIQSSSPTGHHPHTTGGLLEGVLPIYRGSISIFYKPCQQSTYIILEKYIHIYIVVVGDHSRGGPEGSLSIATTLRCRGGHYSFPWIAPLLPLIRTLYCWVLSKAVSRQYLWYDMTWDWTQVSRTIGEHSNTTDIHI